MAATILRQAQYVLIAPCPAPCRACQYERRHSNAGAEFIFAAVNARGNKMKVGLFSLSGGRVTSASMLKTIASNAERLGLSTPLAPEHVVLLDPYSSPYPHLQDGRMLAPSTTLMPGPRQCLAF